MALVVQKDRVTLITALEGIKVTYPEVWGMLEQGIKEMLEPEMVNLVRAPPQVLQVAQGRAQIAQDILGTLHHCSDLAEKLRQASPTPLPGDEPPKFR